MSKDQQSQADTTAPPPVPMKANSTWVLVRTALSGVVYGLIGAAVGSVLGKWGDQGDPNKKGARILGQKFLSRALGLSGMLIGVYSSLKVGEQDRKIEAEAAAIARQNAVANSSAEFDPNTIEKTDTPVNKIDASVAQSEGLARTTASPALST